MHQMGYRPTWIVKDGPWKNDICPNCSECGVQMYYWGMVKICDCQAYLCPKCFYSKKCKNDLIIKFK